MNKSYLYQNMIGSPLFGWLKLYGLLVLAGIAAPLLLLVSELVILPSAVGYSLVRDSISSLAWAGMGWVQNVSFLTTGLLVEGFAAILLLGVPRARGLDLGIALLACSGFGLILLGAFRTDTPNILPTFDGTIHGIAANTTFVLLPLAGLFIAPSLRKNPHWKPLFAYSIATAVFALIWIAIYRLFLPSELTWFGLYERILAIDEVLWVELMAIWLLRQFRRQTFPEGVRGSVPITNS
jgi:hypothetical membrane protein